MAIKRMLMQGMKGEDVKEIQTLLAKMGYNILPDGIYGVITANIIRDVQRRNKLPVTGAVDIQTYKKIIELTTSPPTPFKPTIRLLPVPHKVNERSDPRLIKKLQQNLQDLGYNIITPHTGVWDRETAEAVRLAKKDYLGKIGIVSSKFLSQRDFLKLDAIASSFRKRTKEGYSPPVPLSYQKQLLKQETNVQRQEMPEKTPEETPKETPEEIPDQWKLPLLLSMVVLILLLRLRGNK